MGIARAAWLRSGKHTGCQPVMQFPSAASPRPSATLSASHPQGRGRRVCTRLCGTAPWPQPSAAPHPGQAAPLPPWRKGRQGGRGVAICCLRARYALLQPVRHSPHLRDIQGLSGLPGRVWYDISSGYFGEARARLDERRPRLKRNSACSALPPLRSACHNGRLARLAEHPCTRRSPRATQWAGRQRPRRGQVRDAVGPGGRSARRAARPRRVEHQRRWCDLLATSALLS
jgi:hypothetical protein